MWYLAILAYNVLQKYWVIDWLWLINLITQIA